MFKVSIMPFIQSLDKIPTSKLREYIAITFGRTHPNIEAGAANNDKTTGGTDLTAYMVNDYQNDCIGFFDRNEDILYLAIDDYNCDITDTYFAEKKGNPPLINASLVKDILKRINSVAPIVQLYKIQRAENFQLTCYKIPSNRFRHLTLENLLYEVIIEIFNDRDSPEWEVFFDDEQKK